MFLSFALAVVLVAGDGDPTAKTTASQQDVPAQLRGLVRKLGADDLQSREAAELAIVELGPTALPLLPPTTPRTPVEVSERLGRIRQQLQALAVKAARKPSRVTLTGTMKLSEAIQKIEEQTTNRFKDKRADFGQAARDPRVAIDVKDIVFWQAVDQLFDQARVSIYPYAEETDVITFTDQPPGAIERAKRASYHGLFRFEAARIASTRDLTARDSDALRLGIAVSWEPRIQPIHLEQSMADLHAVDENDNPIKVTTTRATLRPAVEALQHQVELTIPLELPDRDVRQIAKLSGKLTAVATGPIEKFEFKNLAKLEDSEQRKAGATVIVDQVRPNRQLHEVRMRVRFDEATTALESHRGWVFKNEAYIVDAAGKRHENLGSQTTSQRPNEVGMSYLFQLGEKLEDFTFVYETPSAIMRLPVQYELTNIPLP